MNRLSRNTKEGIAQKAFRSAALILTVSATAIIAACSQGDGVSIGTGQDPDPVVIDFPIAYIRAPIPTDDNGDFQQTDLREQITFDFGADLFFRDRASPSAEAINITGELTQGLAAIRDVEIAYDGSSLLFAMRFPFDPDVDEEDLPTWNLWEYTFETAELRPIISTASAEIGHDIMPKYLPDGRIVFSSTRQFRSHAVLLDEDKQNKDSFVALDEDQNEFAFNLHIINADGTGIDQISFNQSHDLDPSVLGNGQIVFSRWDHAGPNNTVNLYRVNPDGTGMELYYGRHSHDTGSDGDTIQFMQPRELEDGRLMSLIRPFTDTEGGGELIAIDAQQYVENRQPTAVNIGILSGPAQEDATVNEVSTVAGEPSPGGRYSSVYPILDGTGRLLASWSQCRLLEILPDDGDPATDDFNIVPCTDDRLANLFVQPDPDNPVAPAPGTFTVAPPLYGIWMYDPRDDTQLPVVAGEEGFIFTEVVAADPKVAPPVVLDGSNNWALDPTLVDTNEAILNIRSVYDFDGADPFDIETLADPVQTPAAARPARFLRIEKAVSIPDDDIVDLDNTDFGISTQQGMREIVANIMVEPDGSVITKVPADVALAISVLDENGKRITSRHQNWISLRPGQELKCNGCHSRNAVMVDPGTGNPILDPDTGQPIPISHGRYDSTDSAYAGAPSGALSFPNTDPAWFIGSPGETMAEIRARITSNCVTAPGERECSSIEPSMDLSYWDVWTEDPVLKAANVDIDYLYSDLDPSSAPTSLACMSNWQPRCRSVINYPTTIHPMWSLPRPQFDADDNPIDDGNGGQLDRQCTLCHTQIDPADQMTVIEPAGQLELTDQMSIQEPEHLHAYRELLLTDNLQEVVGDQLVDILVDDVDADGNPITVPVPNPNGSPASIAGARASNRFFVRFEDSTDVNHYGILSGAERRLIAEWLDIGAQYYNNPFDVPP
jgi:hypothetical protein